MKKEEEYKSKKNAADEDTGFVKWLSELDKKSGNIAGGKGANLAEMFNSGFPVPPAFVITAQAYSYFIDESDLKEKIMDILGKIEVEDTEELEKSAKKIRELIENAEMPAELQDEILEAYDNLSVDKNTIEQATGTALSILKKAQEPIFVAVRSSATTEDLSSASFAGQQESFLNIKGKINLIEAVKKCFASLFTARAIYYRQKKGFLHEESFLAAIVQKMIDSEKSGVIFSKNPVEDKDEILIEAIFGLGEGIVSGRVNPDSYSVSKDLKILDKKIADKKIALVRDSSGKTSIVKLTEEKSKSCVLTDYQIKKLADYTLKLEEHYKKPQDIEFAIEQNIYIVQTRPITTKPKEKKEEIKGEILVSGLAASPGIASGKVKIIKDLSELNKIKKGDILVTTMTNPDMVVAMQKSAAIVTDEGGITAHAAIISREMGIPAVIGTKNATNVLKEDMLITVDAFNGKVYAGESIKKSEVEIIPLVKTKTKIKVIVDLPDFAKRAAKTEAKDVGLVRLEGIIAESGKHPLFFVKSKKTDEYQKIIFKGISKIAEHFHEIWIRTSDIRSDEYKNLESSPKEQELNPMLGMHGIRFSLQNKEILKAELLAVKEATEKLSGKKFGIMLPQIISVAELIEVKDLIKELGIKHIKKGVMIETPAACQIIEELCEEGIDFISFGTNDLTQFTLAIDRGNEKVQYLYDEMHPAVLSEIKDVIEVCKRYNVETSICGQAGSNREMVEFLIENGIDSISVNADSAHEISAFVAELEGASVEEEVEKPEEKKEEHLRVEEIDDVNIEKEKIEKVKEELTGKKSGEQINIEERIKNAKEKITEENELAEQALSYEAEEKNLLGEENMKGDLEEVTEEDIIKETSNEDNKQGEEASEEEKAVEDDNEDRNNEIMLDIF